VGGGGGGGGGGEQPDSVAEGRGEFDLAVVEAMLVRRNDDVNPYIPPN
jgi:hypothetical protein